MLMSSLFDVREKVVLVTGACGVLGTAIVQYFAKEGAKVVLLAREKRREQAEAIVAGIQEAGGEALFVASDVMDEALLKQNCEEILAHYGRIDVLMNAAGGNFAPANVRPDQTLFDLDIDAMRRVCDLNIFGTVIPTKVFAGPMVALVNKLGIKGLPEPDLSALRAFVDKLRNPSQTVDIALVGKYVALQDAYKSIEEAFVHAGVANGCKVQVHRVLTSTR